MCSNYSVSDRCHCLINDCPLWPWRQGRKNTTDEEMKQWQGYYTETAKDVEPELFQNEGD